MIAHLRTEYMTNPLGIGAANPRLSWELNDARRGARQSAYQVQVARSEATLGAGNADLWDSRMVIGDQSCHIPYGGQQLESGERAWWRVRVWDADDQASEWSETAWWEMGLLARGDWQGQWIAGSLLGGPRTTVPAPFFRTTFRVEKPIAQARLYITALGLYEAQINGQRVGANYFTPGWTDYNIRVQYQVYDVAALLQTGENVLGAILGDGWYCGHVEWRGRQRYGERPALLAQLVIRFEDGTRQLVVSDGNWNVTYGPILESDMLMGESYDARRELTGWGSAGYDDSHWQHADLLPDPGIALSPMRGPTVQQITELQPVGEPRQIKGGPTPRWLFDLGQNMVGWVRLKISGPAGTTITLRHAEILDADGTLYTANLRTATQTEHYTLSGEGEEIYEPRFTFHGFRYVELSGLASAPGRDTVTGVVLHSNTPPTGSFTCSDPLINQLQHNIEWGQRGNFVDVPTDCPQRDERLGWMGDAQVFIRTAAFNMDVASFFTKWLRDVEDAQTPDGAYPSIAPNTGVVESDGGPAWADAGIICPWTIYQCYGDTALLAEQYNSMARFVAYMRDNSISLIRVHPQIDAWAGYGDWLAQDGPGHVEGITPKDLIGTAFFAESAKTLAKIAAVLGKNEDAARYTALAEDVRQGFLHRFVTPDGQIVGNTQTAYVLALHFDLLPKDLRPAAITALVRDIEKRGIHLSTGFVGTPYLNAVLAENGHLELAYALLNQKTWPSWLYSVTQGATTIWERWDGWTEEKGFQDPGMNSFNHYAYGAIGAWMYTTIGGIDLDPAQPGYKHSIMQPRPGGGITSATTELHSIYGPIRSAWQLEDEQLAWQIHVPANTTATVHIPAFQSAVISEGSADIAQAEGVRFVGRTAEAAVFEVAAGAYHFLVKW